MDNTDRSNPAGAAGEVPTPTAATSDRGVEETPYHSCYIEDYQCNERGIPVSFVSAFWDKAQALNREIQSWEHHIRCEDDATQRQALIATRDQLVRQWEEAYCWHIEEAHSRLPQPLHL